MTFGWALLSTMGGTWDSHDRLPTRNAHVSNAQEAALMKLIRSFLFLTLASGLPTVALAATCSTAISGVMKDIDTASSVSDDQHFYVSIGTSSNIYVWHHLGENAGRAIYELFQTALSMNATVQITKCTNDRISGIRVTSPYTAQDDQKK
jgi:hypothetical protein